MGWFKKALGKAAYLTPAGPALVAKDMLTGGRKTPAPTSGDDLRQNAAAAIAQQSTALGDIPKAYNQARAAANTGRANSIQYAQDAGTQQQAQASQSLADRGLYNTTVLDNARQGISSGVSRAIADIDTQHAQILAELGLGETNAKNQIRNNISGIRTGLGQSLTQNNQFNAQLRQQWDLANDPNQWLHELLGIGGSVAGAYFGRGISGGGGGGTTSRGVRSDVVW